MIEIKKIIIHHCKGWSDTIYLHTTLPEACWPYEDDQLSLSFRAAEGTGEEYVKKHFPGIPIRVINI